MDRFGENGVFDFLTKNKLYIQCAGIFNFIFYSTDLNKTWDMNELDRPPVIVFPSILLSKNNILYLNSKLYTGGTKRTGRKTCTNILNNILHSQQDKAIREKTRKDT